MGNKYCYISDESTRLALRFEGSANSYVNVPAATAINNLFTGNISINFWIRSEATTGTVWSRLVNSSANRNRMILNTSSTNYTYSVILYNTAGTAFTTTTSTTFTPNTWYNITVTYANAGDRKVHIYTNGSECAYSAQPAMTGTADSDSSAALRIGDNNATGALTGKLDEFVIWSTILTSTYITYLYTPINPLAGMGTYGDKTIYPFNYLCVLGYHFDEGTGTTINDFIGSNTGTAGSACAFKNGRIYPYGVARYNGHIGNSGTTITSTVTLSSSVSADFTLSNWFKVYSTGSASDNYLLDLAAAGAGGVQVYITGANKYLKVDVDGSNKFTISSSFADLTWHNLVITRSGTTMELWIDGVSQGTQGVSATNYTRFFLSNYVSGGKAFYGYIDETNLWTRKVTDAEVGDLYNSRNGMFYYPTDTFPSTSTTMSTNILGAWHIDEIGTSGTPLTDSSTLGNHLVTTGYVAGNWVTSTFGGTTYTGVVSGQTWNTARNRCNEFAAHQLYAGDTVRVLKSPDPVQVVTGGNNVNGTWTTNPNGLAQGGILKTITAATNAAPIVCTTAAGHGLVDGDIISLTGVGGNTSANGIWKVTSVDATHFTLVNSKGNAAWTSGGSFWTLNSRAVKLDRSISYNLPRMCTSFWTMGSGVSLANSTHMKSSRALQGTVNVASSQNIVYTDLGGTFDFSAYQFINFDLYTSTAFIENKLGIAFYSNADGTGLIATYYHPGSIGATNWIKGVIDTGGALPSGVKSVGIVSNGALNLGTTYFDTIWFSKPVGADHINSFSLIGDSNAVGTKYYAIDQIVDDVILLGNAPGSFATTPVNSWGYYGTSGTRQLYTREGLKYWNELTYTDTPGYTNVPGTAGNLINWEFGYNPSNSTQDGETWAVGLKAGGNQGLLVNVASSSYCKVNLFNSAWFGTGVNVNGAVVGSKVYSMNTACSTGFSASGGSDCMFYVHGYNCATGITISGTNHTIAALSGTEIDCSNCYSANGAFNLNTSKNFVVSHDVVAHACINGSGINWSNLCSQGVMKNLLAKWNTTGGISTSVSNNLTIGDIDISYGTWGGMSLAGGSCGTFTYVINSTINSITATNIGGYGGLGQNGFVFTGCSNLVVLGGSTNGGYYSGIDVSGSQVVLRNFTINNTLPVRYTNTGTNDSSKIYFEKYGGVFGTDIINNPTGLIQRDSSLAGFKWKYSPTSIYATADLPLSMDLAKMVVNNGSTYSVSLIVQRDSTNVTGRLFIRGKQLNGISSDLTAVTSGAANSPETITISGIAPSENGVIQVQAQAYGGTSNNLWIKSVSVS